MKYNFSSRFDHITPSGIRAVLEKAAGPDMINFSPGFPDNDAFPTEEIKRISAEVLQEEIYFSLTLKKCGRFDCYFCERFKWRFNNVVKPRNNTKINDNT